MVDIPDGSDPPGDDEPQDQPLTPEAAYLTQQLGFRDFEKLAERHKLLPRRRYLKRLAAGKLRSAYAQNIATVPERGASPADQADPYFRVLVPVTGGMDSLTCWWMASESGLPYELFYVRVAAEYEAAELATIRDLRGDFSRAPDLMLLDARDLPFKRHGHILHGRNAVVFELALQWAERSGWWGELWFGALAGESPIKGGDKSRLFYQDISQTLLPTLRLTTPLIGLDKPDLARYWRDRGMLDILARSKSCFHPTLRACGHCQPCFRKAVAWFAIGEPWAPLFQENGWDWTPYIAKYTALMVAARAVSDYSHYSPSRIHDTLEFCRFARVHALEHKEVNR